MISEITDNIYIGDWQDAKRHRNLFNTIFTVAIDSPFKGDFYYEIEDSGNTNYNTLISAITSLYRIRVTNKSSNILVHCVAGLSRSPVVVAGYLMLRYKIQIHEAMNFITTKRPFVNPNTSLVELLVNSKELNHGHK